MFKLKIIVVDKTRSVFLKQGESFYLARLRHYATIEWIEVKPAKIRKGTPTQNILAVEGKSISKRFLPHDYIISLDVNGKDCDSEGFAGKIQKLSITQERITFVVGGPLGLSPEVLKGAHESLSLSRFTLTHEMSRLLLLEQIYRAFTIINNEKYHK